MYVAKMPFAKFKSVCEVSSEDSNYPAENLIKGSAKKWRTKTNGEKSAVVVIELSEPYLITGIDIGNESSAFIEVLVGKTSNAINFTELLITCSFMTPKESKNLSNPNRVRCFQKEALVSTAVNEKWQYIKIFCSQPFNKHIQFGISFIKLHVTEKVQERSKYNQNDSKYPLFGKFKLRENSPESESDSAVTLFSRWKTSQLCDRNLSKDLYIPAPVKQKKCFKYLDRSPDLSFENEEANESEHECTNIQLKNQTIKRRNECKPTPQSANLIIKRLSSKTVEISRKDMRIITNDTKAEVFLPFNELLKDSVLVISGIQNPARSQLRDKALSMGAKYRTDWEPGCTHLICAFKNTPKYNQVKGKGKIVTRSWIEDCYNQKKKLPWRRYALDIGDRNQPESDKELDESLKRPKLTDVYCNTSNSSNDGVITVFDATTEEEEFLEKRTKDDTSVRNGTFFKGLTFFISDDIRSVERKRIQYLIKLDSGLVTHESDKAQFIISNEQPKFLIGSTNARFIEPNWIYESHDMEMKVPIEKYML